MRLAVALGVLCLVSVASTAHASTYRYEVVDLGVIPGGDRSWGNSLSMGGDAAGTGNGATFDYHAFLIQAGSNLDILPSSYESRSTDINRTGQIVGYYKATSSAGQQAFLWSLASNTDIPRLPGGSDNQALAVNDLGHVVGWSYPGGTYASFPQGFLYKNGTRYELPHLGTSDYNDSWAKGINSTDQIVGWSHADSGEKKAVVWNGTAAPTILPGFAGGYESGEAAAINDHGQIVGRSSGADLNDYITLWQNGTATNLGVLGEAYAINNSGQFVAYASVANVHYLYSAGTWVNLQLALVTPGWTLAYAYDINDRGAIAGTAVGANGLPHAVRLEPVYDPNVLTSPTFGSAPGSLPTGWTASGGGAASVVADPHNAANFAAHLATGSPVTLTQTVSTPGAEFVIAFDYEFLTTNPACTLEISLNSVLLDTLTAPSALAGGWSHYSLLVGDPALRNLNDVNLDFCFDGPESGLQLNLDNAAFQAVPEPATLSLLALGGLALLRRRR